MDNDFETRWGYALEMLWMAALTFYGFKLLVFRRLPTKSDDASLRIALFMMVISLVVTFLLCGKRCRTNDSVLFAAIVPLGLYAFFSLFPYYKVILIAAAMLMVTSVIAFSLWVLMSPVADRQRRPVIMKRRVRNCVAVAGAGLTLCAVVALGCGAFTTLRGGVPLDEKPASKGATLENSLETLINLEESRWETLTAEQRLEVLQVLVSTEMTYLGLPEAELHADVLAEQVLGQMNFRTGIISIDIDHLKTASSHEAVDTVLHECRHVYTRELASVYESISPQQQQLRLFMGIDEYKKDYENYVDGRSKEQRGEYYWQSVEMDAREYASYRTTMVFRRIELYMEEAGL